MIENKHVHKYWELKLLGITIDDNLFFIDNW